MGKEAGQLTYEPMQEEYITKTISKPWKARSVVAAVVVAGRPPLAQGRDARRALHLTGKVVCARCSLEASRPTQADQGRLSQFTPARGAGVGWVRAVTDAPTRRSCGEPSAIPVQAEPVVFRPRIAEENLFTDVESKGALSTTKALDSFNGIIHG